MMGICDLCGQLRTVHKNRKTGEAICSRCYQADYYRDFSTYDRCFSCGKIKQVATRNEAGKAICSVCYRRSKIGECAECKETKVIQAFGLCYGCYQHQRRASMAAYPA